MVPSGDEITLVKGNLVQITQSLGGNHTVIINGNMAQISADNADALGLKIEERESYKPNSDFKVGYPAKNLSYERLEIIGDTLENINRKKYRIRLLIRGPKSLRLQNSLATFISNYKFPNGIKLSVDVDPISFN